MAKSIIGVGQDHSALCCNNWRTEKSSWTFPGMFSAHMRFLNGSSVLSSLKVRKKPGLFLLDWLI